jgi:DNA-binding beta-propeller fold protein YncE
LGIDDASPLARDRGEGRLFALHQIREVLMKNSIWMLAIFAWIGTASAQTTNENYEVVTFGAPPPGEEWGDTISVAADGQGSILVFRRAEPPVLVYDREGELQNSWGEGLFVDTHSIDVDHEGFVWITDRRAHMVYKFTMDGEQLMALGTKGVAGDNSSTQAFNRPSDVLVAPNGDIFVADGYDNNRVVHFSGEGEFIKVIGGTPGTGPGEFEELHGVQLDSRGRLIVLDRHSDDPRLQVWDQDGTFLEEWTGLGLTMGSGFTMDDSDTFYIGDTRGTKIIAVKDGAIVDEIAGLEAAPHNITRDPGTGDIYLADSNEPGQIKKVSKK